MPQFCLYCLNNYYFPSKDWWQDSKTPVTKPSKVKRKDLEVLNKNKSVLLFGNAQNLETLAENLFVDRQYQAIAFLNIGYDLNMLSFLSLRISHYFQLKHQKTKCRITLNWDTVMKIVCFFMKIKMQFYTHPMVRIVWVGRDFLKII